MDRGYIKIWRKIHDESWYTEPLTCHLAIHLLLKANHKDKKVIWNRKAITVNRGQIITGRAVLSRETGLSQQNIRTSLEILKKCEFLTIKSTNKFSIITICNYSKYQDKNLESNQQSNQQPTSSQPAANHKQECIKNNKNNKKTFVGADAPTSTNGRKKEKTFTEESIEYRLANYFFQKILKLNPEHKKPNLQTWAGHIDGMLRLDNRNPEKVKAVIDWLFSDDKQAKFYRKITQSTESLRNRYDTLTGFMNEQTSSKKDSWDDGWS